jgi:glycosyltransferase involved in cell wall biosynthesis
VSENRIDISVVLPSYNAGHTLLQAIDSLDIRPGDMVEALVIDDGSTDGSGKLLRGAAKSRPWLRVLSQPHRGIVAALNHGLAEARGEYIARMDADDESLPGRLLLQKDYLDRHPDIGLVSGMIRFSGDVQNAEGYAVHVEWINSLRAPDDIAISRFIESPVAHPSVMFRRSLIDVHGDYLDGPFPEDYELWLRWMDAGVRFAKVDAPVLCWHDPHARLSRIDSRYSFDAFYATKARYLARWLQRHAATWPDIVVWGAGRTTRKRAAMLERYGAHITAWVDIDPRKVDRIVNGVPVITPDALPAPADCFVLSYVASRNARVEIGQWLEQLGFELGKSWLPAA